MPSFLFESSFLLICGLKKWKWSQLRDQPFWERLIETSPRVVSDNEILILFGQRLKCLSLDHRFHWYVGMRVIAFKRGPFQSNWVCLLKRGRYKICSPSLRNLNMWIMCCHEDFIICNIGELIRCCLTIWFYILGVMVCFFIFLFLFFNWWETRNESIDISEVFYKQGI